MHWQGKGKITETYKKTVVNLISTTSYFKIEIIGLLDLASTATILGRHT